MWTKTVCKKRWKFSHSRNAKRNTKTAPLWEIRREARSGIIFLFFEGHLGSFAKKYFQEPPPPGQDTHRLQWPTQLWWTWVRFPSQTHGSPRSDLRRCEGPHKSSRWYLEGKQLQIGKHGLEFAGGSQASAYLRDTVEVGRCWGLTYSERAKWKRSRQPSCPRKQLVLSSAVATVALVERKNIEIPDRI